MLIPFDNLYDYLDHLIHENIIIYRFFPHGNKKISSIDELNHKSEKKHWGWIDYRTQIHMLIHDQEPLGLGTYDELKIDDFETLLEIHSGHKSQFRDQLFTEYRHLGPMMLNVLRPSIYDKMLLTHSEINSPNLKEYEDLGAIGIYWWSHAMIAKDWYRYAKIDPSLIDMDTNFKYDFNIYNRAWDGTREYRLKFTELIIKNDLKKYSQIKFSPCSNGTHYLQHIFKNKNFQIDIPLDELDENTAAADASAYYSSADYNECAIDVVLETLFDDPRQHLTEKILRPIACGKPFILAGTSGSLEYLKRYGFETFSSVIDESYDLIDDPVQRLQSIINLMKNISQQTDRTKKELFYKMHLIAEHNKKRFWSEEFSHEIINEFIKNYHEARLRVEESKQGENWIKLRKQMRVWDPTLDLTTNNGYRFRKDILALHLEIRRAKKVFN